MADVKTFIDWVFNAAYSFWNYYFSHGGVYASITFILVVVFPLFKRIIRSLRTSE